MSPGDFFFIVEDRDREQDEQQYRYMIAARVWITAARIDLVLTFLQHVAQEHLRVE